MMTEELKALAGKSTELLKCLRPRDLIEFAEKYGVGIEDIRALEPKIFTEALFWLLWKVRVRRDNYDREFETYLDDETAIDDLLSLTETPL